MGGGVGWGGLVPPPSLAQWLSNIFKPCNSLTFYMEAQNLLGTLSS